MKWPESIITAAICVVAEILDYTTSKNVSEETLLRALERLLLASPLPRVNPKRKLRAKKDLLEELVRKGLSNPSRREENVHAHPHGPLQSTKRMFKQKLI